jgi:hypothetical protein
MGQKPDRLATLVHWPGILSPLYVPARFGANEPPRLGQQPGLFSLPPSSITISPSSWAALGFWNAATRPKAHRCALTTVRLQNA